MTFAPGSRMLSGMTAFATFAVSASPLLAQETASPSTAAVVAIEAATDTAAQPPSPNALMPNAPSAANSGDQQKNDAETASQTPPADGIQPGNGPIWSAAVSAGITARKDNPDGTYQIAMVNRQTGQTYLRASMMRYRGTLQQSDLALPSNYYIGTLGAGGNFNNWVFDGWASFGRQVYGDIETSSGKRASTGATGSFYYGLGGDAGKILPLSARWFVTTTINASYAMGKLLRPAPSGSEVVDQETSEPTWTIGGTLRIDRAFGKDSNHYLGLGVSYWWTSNALSELGTSEATGTGTMESFRLESIHRPDTWVEVSASTTFQLTPRLNLDLLATHSLDNLAGDTLTIGASLRRQF